jgi:hypothetical protein
MIVATAVCAPVPASPSEVAASVLPPSWLEPAVPPDPAEPPVPLVPPVPPVVAVVVVAAAVVAVVVGAPPLPVVAAVLVAEDVVDAVVEPGAVESSELHAPTQPSHALDARTTIEEIFMASLLCFEAPPQYRLERRATRSKRRRHGRVPLTIRRRLGWLDRACTAIKSAS